MPLCNGFCPVADQGYDPLGDTYWFTARNCNISGNPITIVSDSRAHEVGGTCADCVDCIEAFRSPKAEQAEFAPQLLGGKHLRRGAFRKGVPCPRNRFAKPDEFQPGPNSAVLAEYTAEYRRGRNYLVRLFTVGSEEKVLSVFGLGWELDPKSPPSPFFVPHFSSRWIRKVTPIPGGHLVEVDQIGSFRVLTRK